MKNKGFIVRLLAVLIAPCMLFFFSDNTAQAEDIATLTIGTTMEVKKIDIEDYYFGIMRGMLTHMGLIQLNEQGDFSAGLADSWETEDASTWIFHLKKNILWHDGENVTADDVKFSLEYLKEKIPVYKHHFKLLEKAEAPDHQTLILHLSEPNPRFLVNLLVLRVIPEHIFKNVADPKLFSGNEAAVGCGPYRFDKFDQSAGVVSFKANDAYFKGRPNIKKIHFRMFKNPDTMYLAFKKGEIDLPYFYAAGTDPFNVPSLEKNRHIKIGLINNLGVPNVLFFNNKKEPLNNAEFRKALSFAINYEDILRIFAAGYGNVPNSGFLPEGSNGFISTPPLTHDPEKTRALLAELGYKDENNDGLLEKDGNPLKLELVVRTDVPGSMRLGELLKKQFESVGIGLTLKTVDHTLFRQICERERSHEMVLTRTTPWGMMMWAGCGTGYVDARNIGWAAADDPDFIQIVDRMNVAMNTDDYKKAAADLQNYYSDNLPVVPLYWNTLIQPYHEKFSGWKINPMYGYLCEDTWFGLEEKK